MTYDALIIGTGPAGISAALYLARAGYAVLSIGKGRGALERAESIENYYGFPDALTGSELADRGVAQAKRLGVTILSAEVVQLGLEDTFLTRISPDGLAAGAECSFRARTVLLATGKSRAAVKASGFEELRGRGISFCATCDGFFYRDKPLALIGSGEYAASELEELLHFTKDITIFTNGEPLPKNRFPSGIPIVSGKIVAFVGTDRLSGIRVVPDDAPATEDAPELTTAEPRLYRVDGAFVAIGTAGAADFAAKIGVETEGTDIVVDREFMTNVPGVFAAGDCVGGFLQIAKAVSDGALAAKGMISFLKKN